MLCMLCMHSSSLYVVITSAQKNDVKLNWEKKYPEVSRASILRKFHSIEFFGDRYNDN